MTIRLKQYASRTLNRASFPAIWPAIWAAVVLVFSTTSLNAADHRDGSIAQDQPADIADTYAFINPNDRSKVVLGVTVNPYTVPGVTASFSTDVLYQIKIDNDGDFKEDLVFQARFNPLGGSQQLSLIGPAQPMSTGQVNNAFTPSVKLSPPRGQGPLFEGPADGTILTAPERNLRVFAGRTDDPFFIDLIFVRSVLSVPGIPALPDLLAIRDPGVDLFTGLNVSSLMIELPVEDIMGSSATINVWSTVNRQQTTKRVPFGPMRNNGQWVQIDREGLPAINAALVPPALRDDFNRGLPHRDQDKFSAAIAAFLDAKPNLPIENHFDLVNGVLLPDVLRLDPWNFEGGLELLDNGDGTYTPSLNGRAPRDDFIDLFLFVLSNGALIGDGLAANDCTPAARGVPCDGMDLDNGFPRQFPFLGAEHQPDEAIAPRN